MENKQKLNSAVLPGFLDYMNIDIQLFPKINYIIIDNSITAKNKLLCPICYELKADYYSIKECNHKFCTKCISRWYKVKKQCPLCRKKFKYSNKI